VSQHALPHDFSTNYLQLVRGEGVYVYDADGNRYLDAVGGVGAVNIGHAVPEIVAAIQHQAATLAFAYGGTVDNDQRQRLAAKLQQWVPAGMGETRTLFCAGGAEANEGALKLAHQYHWERGLPTKQKVVGRWQSFHGNTIATLSMGGRTSWRAMQRGMLLDFPHIRPPYAYRHPGEDLARADELARCIDQEGAEHIAGFIAEPVIGTSLSAVVPNAGYYPRIRSICDSNDVLFIADEVMCGVGRTGYRAAIDHWGVAPDIITLGKGISGGYSPLAAIVLWPSRFGELLPQAAARRASAILTAVIH
jgi:adenosylmethionine-8-amino-7-oxononanoate aminotransferase